MKGRLTSTCTHAGGSCCHYSKRLKSELCWVQSRGSILSQSIRASPSAQGLTPPVYVLWRTGHVSSTMVLHQLVQEEQPIRHASFCHILTSSVQLDTLSWTHQGQSQCSGPLCISHDAQAAFPAVRCFINLFKKSGPLDTPLSATYLCAMFILDTFQTSHHCKELEPGEGLHFIANHGASLSVWGSLPSCTSHGTQAAFSALRCSMCLCKKSSP